ncbi:MAG: hypothetical protein JWQ48_3567 [Conexibacter sp.]|nr:hypothetical protein [Conexibacter sp.]
MRFADPAFQERLQDALNADEEFALESRWFDGSILLECGPERCWLKVYRGQVIDRLEFVPAFGYTFKLVGSEDAWRLLVSGERTFTDLATSGSRHCETLEQIVAGGGGYRPPEIGIEGNGIEAGRLHLAILRLAAVLAALGSTELAAAGR